MHENEGKESEGTHINDHKIIRKTTSASTEKEEGKSGKSMDIDDHIYHHHEPPSQSQSQLSSNTDNGKIWAYLQVGEGPKMTILMAKLMINYGCF